jgi:hypothetical protein
MTRRSTLATAGSLLAGMAVFTWVRWEEVTEWGGGRPILVVPIALTYLAAAALGLLLAKDGVTRWWWVPGTLLVGLGSPVDYWVGSSVVATSFGFGAGALVDLVAVLFPAGIVWVRTRRAESVRVRGRLIPTLLVGTIAAILSMRVGVDGPDLSVPVGAALLALGIFSQSSSWMRASAFVLIAVALGAQIPASLAISLSQGFVGPVAFVDALVDVAVALLAFSIAPLSTVSRRLFERQLRGVPAQASN